MDLLPEDGDEAVAVFGEEGVAERGGIECFELLGAEGADVVEVYMTKWLTNVVHDSAFGVYG